MGIKSKVTGLVLAAVMTMSVAGSAIAQDSADGIIRLDGGTCAVEVASGSFDFGTATWNGSYWRHDNNRGSRVTLDVDPGWTGSGSNGECTVVMSTAGLSNGTHTLDRSYFRSTEVFGTPGQIFPEQTLPSTFHLEGGETEISVRMREFAPRFFTPGVYTGTFDFTISDGQ